MSVLSEVTAPIAIDVVQQRPLDNGGQKSTINAPASASIKSTSDDTIQITILSAPCSPASSVDYTDDTDRRTSPTKDEAKLARQPVVLVQYPELSDEQLWEPWFAFPSRPHMTLHRWAEGQKSRLNMHIHTSPSIPTEVDFHTFLTYSRWTLSSLKILVLGSILLIRGVQHGPQMGRTLFGRMLGDRYNDLMAFGCTSHRSGTVTARPKAIGVPARRADGSKVVILEAAPDKQGQGKDVGTSAQTGSVDDEARIRSAVEEARALQLRGNEFFAEGKYEASLEHYGMAIVRVIPWDLASLSPALARKTGFVETDQALMLSIALTSLRMVQILPPRYRAQTFVSGSRLYRLTRAACDYVKLSPVPSTPSSTPSSPSSVSLSETSTRTPATVSGAESDVDTELDLVGKLEALARELAGVGADSLEDMEMGLEGGKSVREVRRSMERYFGLP
ncbi:hypothetical protein IAU59_003526 [Kwoniella sp. CBS 9459]